MLCFVLVGFGWLLTSTFDIPFLLLLLLHFISYSFSFRSVPHLYAPNPRLAQWVKRQRHYYRRKHSRSASKMNLKPPPGPASSVSSLTDERESALNRLNFCWNSHEELWNQRFMELQKYKEEFGDCNVPIHYAENKQLAVWTKTQRR